MIPPPPSEAREAMERFVAAENWAGLIESADATASEYILWLDPHRYVALALEKLGADAARVSLMREVAALLSRAEGLHTLTFNDGTPIADADTQAWITDEVLKAFGGGGGGGGGAVKKSGSPVDGAINEAKNLAANGQLPEAMAAIAKVLPATPKPSDRFRGQLEMAKLCLQAGQFAIARAQLEGLDRQAERHHLAEWEPALAADLYGALFSAHRGMSSMEEVTPEARARQTAVFERLCQLDAGAALRLMAG
jgi:type VI secretion system protein VasJ